MTITKILIGIDDSKYAEHAALYGFDIARKFNAAVGVVNIVEPTTLVEPSLNDPMIGGTDLSSDAVELELMDIQKDQSESVVDQIIVKLAAEMDVAHFTGYGPTADGIISCGKEFGADLIVIGSHSRTGIDRFLMGDVAAQVIRHSSVPVLVVPFKEEV